MAQPTIEQWARQLIIKIEKVAEVAVEETVVESAREMKTLIKTRGTDRQWSGYYIGRSGIPRNRSGRGRIDSGNMLDSVSSQYILDVSNIKTGEFGWIKGDPENYFVKQEEGFYNQLSSSYIEPMNALRDSFTYATLTVVNKIKKGLSSI
jgi:hypothetical protein